MADAPLNKAVRRTLLRLQGADGLTDAQLLERFTTQHEESAFEALVRRHGPMVLRVCQRALSDPHLAEDAFQATFIILMRKAPGLARPHFANGSVGAWLHKVAYHVACRALRGAVHRRVHERRLDERVAEAGAAAPGPAEAKWEDVRPVLDEELNRLPEKYRAPLVLCYLEGKTNEEAARQLHWPSGTAKSRLARARDMLRQRLARRGLTLSAGGLATSLAQDSAAAAVPHALLTTTVTGVTRAATGAAASGFAPQVLTLAQAAQTAMTWAKVRPWGMVLAGLAVLALSLATVLHRGGASGEASGYVARGALGNHPGVNQVLFAANETRMVSVARNAVAGAEASVKSWDLTARRELASFRVEGTALALAPDGETLAVQDRQGIVRLHNTRTGTVSVTLEGPMQPSATAAFSPDGRAIAVADRGQFSGQVEQNQPVVWKCIGALGLWDRATGRRLPLRIDYSNAAYLRLTWSPDGKTLAAIRWPDHLNAVLDGKGFKQPSEVGWDGYLAGRGVLLDVASGKERATFPGPNQSIPGNSHLAFSPDGHWLVTRSGASVVPGPLRIINVATGGESRSLSTLWGTDLVGLGFTPDGKRVFEATVEPGPLAQQVCRLAFHGTTAGNSSGQTVLRVPIQYAAGELRPPTTIVAISRNGGLVAVGQVDGAIELWSDPAAAPVSR